MAENAAEEKAASRDREAAKAESKRSSSSSEEQTFPVERLLAESHDFFGQPSYILAGALEHGGVRKKNLTRDEASSAIDAFLAHEVTTGEEQ